jgi:hypothetical protein
MAYDGELVKMENGRWARFARCRIHGAEVSDILVAVELDERYQDLLSAAETSIDEYRQRGVPFSVRLEPDDEGRMNLSVHEAAAAVH